MPAWCGRTTPAWIASTSPSRTARWSRLAPEIRAEDAAEVFDAKRLLAFPGCVDAHMHVGIYRPLAEDAVSESKAAAMGGVTSSLNYIRTGTYYLNRGGPYREVMPEVLQAVGGTVLGRLRLSRRADRRKTSRRDGISRARTRRDVVQDFHVLWRLWPARQILVAERVPDAGSGRPLRHRPFRVHHAIGALRSWNAIRNSRTISASACIASLPISSTPTRRWSSARAS